MAYRVIDYDVWGNEEDGFYVNSAFFTNEILEIPEEVIESDSKLIKFLQDNLIIRSSLDYKDFEIEGEPDHTLYFTYKGKPEFELRFETES